jgi:hypothetical protein
LALVLSWFASVLPALVAIHRQAQKFRLQQQMFLHLSLAKR